MRARDFLEQIERNECLIKNKLAERSRWLEMATSSTAKVGGIRVQSSGDNTAKQNQILEIVTIDEDVARLKADIRYRISMIQKLKTSDYNFLHMVYVQHMTLKEVSVDADKSYSWATAKHKKALKHLEKLLEEEEKRQGF